MRKRIALLFLGLAMVALSAGVRMNGDGDPPPICPTKVCPPSTR